MNFAITVVAGQHFWWSDGSVLGQCLSFSYM